MGFGKKDTRENFFTGDENPGVEEPWRCDGCNHLIYNVCLENGQLYPATGAPIPKYLNPDYKKVCSLCLAMHTALNDSGYFRSLREESSVAKKARQRQWEGMG